MGIGFALSWLIHIEEYIELVFDLSRTLAAIKNMSYHYQEYLALGEEICAALPFKSYFTLKHGCWPKNVDEDSFKGTGQKLKRSEHQEQVEEHTSSHVEDMCIEED